MGKIKKSSLGKICLWIALRITIKIYCLEATPKDHGEDSPSGNDDRAQESETTSFIILPLTGAQTPDLSQKAVCFQMWNDRVRGDAMNSSSLELSSGAGGSSYYGGVLTILIFLMISTMKTG